MPPAQTTPPRPTLARSACFPPRFSSAQCRIVGADDSYHGLARQPGKARICIGNWDEFDTMRRKGAGVVWPNRSVCASFGEKYAFALGPTGVLRRAGGSFI
jgi:hypothetical protein